MTAGVTCPVCGSPFDGVGPLAHHFVGLADASDPRHIMWMNRHVTKRKSPAEELEPLLASALAGGTPPAARVRR